MAARTSREAVEALAAQLRPLLACLTPAQLVSGRAALTLSRIAGAPPGWVPLGGPYGLLLQLIHGFRAEQDPQGGGWVARTTSYYYALQADLGAELVAYHYHPAGPGALAMLHLHVRTRRFPHAGGTADLGKVHFPTGYVPFVAVARLAIAELGIPPRRPDWPRVLDQAEADFRA